LKLPASTRSVAIHENAEAIERWRSTLSERRRRRLIHPLSNVRGWRAATAQNDKNPGDLQRKALAHFRQFCRCIEAMPPDQGKYILRLTVAEMPLIAP
jgi:hypothetical protein